MKNTSKLLLTIFALAFTLIATGCGSSNDTAKADPNAPLKIGVTAGPHAELMDHFKALAKKEGLNIEVVEFADYVTPNTALAQGELFANSMQHEPYLKATNDKNPSYKLVNVFNTVNFPMAAYSDKLKRGDQIPDNAIISIPNDPSNGARALLVLDAAGVIKVKDNKNVMTSVNDIVENPHNITFQELDAAAVPRSLQDVTLAVINTNYALELGFNPVKDSIYLEPASSPFVNIFVTTEKNLKDPRIQKIKKLYQSAAMEDFIKEKYKGSVTPGWK